MNEPYIVKVSPAGAMMFGCETDARVREFGAKFDGWEYESEFERVCYLLGTDVFIEVCEEDAGFLSLREWDGFEHWRVRAEDEILRAIGENDEGGAAYLLLSPAPIAPNELRDAFADRPPQEFARIIEGLETKYGCQERMACYIVCYFTPKGKEAMRAEFGD